jgi:hypothetical protein
VDTLWMVLLAVIVIGFFILDQKYYFEEKNRDKVQSGAKDSAPSQFDIELKQILDFNDRFKNIDDEAVGLILAASCHEFFKLFKSAPESEQWFSKLDRDFQIELSNLANALDARIQKHQLNFELAATPHLMVIMHTARGIIDKRLTLAAVEMWDELQRRGRPTLDQGIEGARTLLNMEFSEDEVYRAQYFSPTALHKKERSLWVGQKYSRS